MTLREAKGNMYEFVNFTWNVIKGRCLHNCKYCYMKIFPQNKLRFDEKILKDNLGKDNFIFVGSSTDMWAVDVPEDWILKVLKKCNNHSNKYLFQSKNPERFISLWRHIPGQSVLGTTIETNRCYKEMGKAPDVKLRASSMRELKQLGFETMITIEPIMDFDLKEFVGLIKLANPTWVNIGADSKKHNLPEPSMGNIIKLVAELVKFTEIRKKSNLVRLADIEDL